MPKPVHNLPYLAKNIRTFRKLRTLKIYELADKIGMTEAHFGRIERGLNVPSAAVISQIAEILNIPPGKLFENPEKNERNIIHFRGKKQLSGQTAQKIDKIIEMYKELEDFCHAGKYRSFPLDIPLRDYSNDDIEEAAELTRELLGIRYAVVFDMFDLFESNGLRIIILDLPEGTSGFSYGDSKTNTITLFINSTITIERKIYTLAHELGHVIFHQGGFKHLNGIIDYPVNSVREINYEHAANYFAACFLMPAKTIKTAVKQMGISRYDWSFDLLLRIKKRFGVSAESFLARLKELDLIEMQILKNIKKQVLKYYKENGHMEPSPSVLSISQNNRLWDLVLIAKTKKSFKKKFENIDLELKKLGLAK